jgi:hypothetical protein
LTRIKLGSGTQPIQIGSAGEGPVTPGSRCGQELLSAGRQIARPLMELPYMKDVADDRGLEWEYAERVLSSRDLDEWMLIAGP